MLTITIWAETSLRQVAVLLAMLCRQDEGRTTRAWISTLFNPVHLTQAHSSYANGSVAPYLESGIVRPVKATTRVPLRPYQEFAKEYNNSTVGHELDGGSALPDSVLQKICAPAAGTRYLRQSMIDP